MYQEYINKKVNTPITGDNVMWGNDYFQPLGPTHRDRCEQLPASNRDRARYDFLAARRKWINTKCTDIIMSYHRRFIATSNRHRSPILAVIADARLVRKWVGLS